MLGIFESITRRLVETWKSDEPSGRRSAFSCRCGRPVYFRNSLCLGCQAPLGYEPELQQVRAMTPASDTGPEPQLWTLDSEGDEAAKWVRCENFHSPAGCNWLVRANDPEPLCRSCRLNQTIPNLDDPDNALWWRKIENAKRRLVAQLLTLGLPVVSKV